MKCCGPQREPNEAVEYDPRATYRFAPRLALRCVENLGYALTAGVLMAVLLCLPGGTFSLSLPMALGVGGLIVLALMVALTLPLFSPACAREVLVGPDGITITQHNGTRDALAWPRLKGYVHEGDRYVFFLQDGRTVTLIVLGLGRSEKALLAVAIRKPLEAGSLRWRGEPERAPRGVGRGSLLVSLVTGVAVVVLVRTDRVGAALVALLAGVGVVGALLWRESRRR